MYEIISFPDIHLRFTTLLSLFPLFLYHSHQPRNKDIRQADIITIFANICYGPISVLLLLPFSFCMYELALISPRKVNTWINVSGLNRAERMKHMYETTRVVFVHPGLCWAPPVPWDTVWRPRPPWQKYTDWPEEETGRPSIQGNTNFLENKVWREADWGCQPHLLCCHTGIMGKDWQTAALSSQRLTWTKQKEEGDGGQSIRGPQDLGARPEDMVAVRLVLRVRGSFQDQHVFRKWSVHPGKKTG